MSLCRVMPSSPAQRAMLSCRRRASRTIAFQVLARRGERRPAFGRDRPPEGGREGVRPPTDRHDHKTLPAVLPASPAAPNAPASATPDPEDREITDTQGHGDRNIIDAGGANRSRQPSVSTSTTPRRSRTNRSSITEVRSPGTKRRSYRRKASTGTTAASDNPQRDESRPLSQPQSHLPQRVNA